MPKSESKLDGMQPELLWKRFRELSRVPRPSKKETQALDYVKHVISGLGFRYRQDEAGNIVVSKPATAGCEGGPVVALQAHVDMVCEKDHGAPHDFENDPITLLRDGDWITADGTTLGADNGIGVAALLAILEATDLVHPAVECLFTVDEETGLTGAMALDSDFIEASVLLNLDSEDDGTFYIGCAGGIETHGTLELRRVDPPPGTTAAAIVVDGLKGGHSGCDIHRGRADAIKVLAGLLDTLIDRYDVQIASISGGDKVNAIPREAQAVVCMKLSDFEKAQGNPSGLLDACSLPEGTDEPGLRIRLEKCDTDCGPIETEQSIGVTAMLKGLPHGVVKMSGDIEGLVETSTNLASVTTTRDRLIVCTSQRSSSDADLSDISKRVAEAMNSGGMRVETDAGYPGWQPDLSSRVLALARQTFRELRGKEPEVTAIHAGLECGVIRSKFPGIDVISLGPTLEDAHSPAERVSISSVERFWELLCAILAKTGKQ